MKFEAMLIKLESPPLLPPPMRLLNLDWKSSFMIIVAALLITCCLVPEAALPDWSNKLLASDMAMLISWVLEPAPLPPPEVNCFRIRRK